MPFAAINGQKLFYTDSGGEGKPVLVFSHGLLMDHSMFDPQVAALKDSYRCIAWDERGHGQTATPGTCAPFSYYDSADDLAALLAYLGVQQAVLVGMSQGGYLSLRCALTHPEVVRALVLIDTQAMPEDPALMPQHMAMVQRWVQSGMDDGMAATVESFILGNHWDGANEWKIKWKQVDAANLVQCFTTLGQRDDISQKIAQIQVPALVIHGSDDRAIAPERAKAMVQTLPQWQWVEIAGAGHAPNLTHPAPVNQAMTQFLSTLA
ncbi:MAG: alpha/beta hydrolase [Comamonas sp.]